MVRQRTRDRIIGVAAEIFATVGLRRTTMEGIAAAAGRGRRTLYMYFSNKAEIYEAVVENEISRIISPLREVIATEKSFDLMLHRYSDERTRALNELGKRNPLLLKDFAQGHSRVEKLRDRLNKEEMKILVPVFSHYLKDHNLSDGATPEEYALIYLNMLRGNDRFLTGSDGLDKDKHMSFLSTDMFLKGFGTLIK